MILLFLCGFQLEGTAQQKTEVIIPGLYQMPEVSPSNVKTSNLPKAAVREDLHKFMGYEILPSRYLSLPFDVNIKNNIDSFFTDVGFLLLLLFPILFLFPQKKKQEQVPQPKTALQFTMIGLLALMMIISIPSAYLNKHNLSSPTEGLQHLNAASATGFFAKASKQIESLAFTCYAPIHQWFTSVSGESDAITYPILILLFFGLLVLFYQRVEHHSPKTKAMVAFTMVYFFLWWILGSGAAWYGMLLFCIPYIFLLKGMSPDEGTSSFFASWKTGSGAGIKNGILLLSCCIWMLMAFAFRSTNYSPNDAERAKHIYIPPIMEYQTGKINEKTLLGFHFPQYHEIQKIINQEDESLVYRVGSSINYFIRKNDSRVFNDTFLDFFDRLIQRFKDKEKIVQALKASGFKYIVFDLQMIQNDFTPEKSLTKKFTQFMNTLYQNPGVELLVTNRTIQLNSNGQIVNAVFEDSGNIINSGQIALFKIK